MLTSVLKGLLLLSLFKAKPSVLLIYCSIVLKAVVPNPQFAAGAGLWPGPDWAAKRDLLLPPHMHSSLRCPFAPACALRYAHASITWPFVHVHGCTWGHLCTCANGMALMRAPAHPWSLVPSLESQAQIPIKNTFSPRKKEGAT